MSLTKARDVAVFLAAIALGVMCADDVLGNPIGRRLRGAR